MSYHNCSCSLSKPSPNPPDDFSDEAVSSPLEKRHGCDNAQVSSCQSLPVSDFHGMQNSCDVCRDCYETCSCAGSSFPLRTSTLSVLRGFALPRNSCRCLRRNSYQEKNALSVCCFDKKTPRLRGNVLLNLGKTTGLLAHINT